MLSKRIQYIQDTFLNKSRECEYRMHEAIQKFHEKQERLSRNAEVLSEEENSLLVHEMSQLKLQIDRLLIEKNIWNEAWALSSVNPPEENTTQAGRCIACGRVVPEQTSFCICYQCREDYITGGSQND